MKTVVLNAIRKMDMEDRPAPVLENDDDVLLRVRSCGVCGSDVHYYAEGRIGEAVVAFPHVVGHEFSGTVEAVGSAVKDINVGQLVAVDPAIPCGDCDQCRAGRMHTCRHCVFRSFPGQADGALSEYVVMPAKCCFPTREGTSPDQASLVEPLSVGVHAVSLYPRDVSSASIAILGAGPIGLSVLFAAMAKGAEGMVITDKLDYRIETARSCGATWAGTPDELDARAGGASECFDVVWECSGDLAAIDQAFDLLKPGGVLLIVGIPSATEISFSVDNFRRKELTVIYVRRQNESVQAALDIIETTDIPVEAMITHRLPFDRSGEAFEMASNYSDGVIKAAIHVDE